MKRWKCSVCGKIFEGEQPPVPCPVCNAGREAFVQLEQPAVLPRWHCTVCGRVFEGEEPPVPCPVCKAARTAFEKLEPEAIAFQQNTDDQYVLVGGGIAALEAAKAIRLRNKTASVVILSDEAHYPYNRPALSGVVAHGHPFESLLLEKPEYYSQNHIEVHTGVKAESIDSAAKTVQLSSGGSIPYTKLLLATGSYPFNPIQRGNNSIPVYVLRSFEDAEALAQACAGRRVVLVGGGILGLEAATALHAHHCQLTIVEFAPRILSLQADEACSARLQAKLEELGIRVLTGKSVASAGQQGVQLSDGTELAADLVLASMGVRSETELAKPLGLAGNRGIAVDAFMHTSHPDIWAAGDCAEYDGRTLALAGTAASMGAVAGASMAGDETTPYTPFIPATTFEVQGLSLFSVGAVSAPTPESLLYQNADTGSYKRLFGADGKLVGALFMGENPGAKAIHAVAEGLPFAKAASLLFP